MTRREVLALTLFSLLLVVVGVVWMFGAAGLIVSGLTCLALCLFGVNIEGATRGEPVDHPAQQSRHRSRAAL